MAGRRLLDVAAIFNVSRSVARKHVTLRTQQLDRYGKTSVWVKAVRHGGASAATQSSKLAANSQDQGPRKLGQDDAGSIPRTETVARENPARDVKEGLEQDHFYERSDTNTIVDQPSETEFNPQQKKAKRHPLPDGSIPPPESEFNVRSRDRDVFTKQPKTEPPKDPLKAQRAQEAQEPVGKGQGLNPESASSSTIPDPDPDIKPSSPDKARTNQRQSEYQIPSKAAEQPPTPATSGGKLGEGRDDDIFYKRSQRAPPVLSSLPRTKIPRQTEDTQNGDEHVEDGKINSDVFYSSQGHQEVEPIPQKEVLPEQEQVPDDINTDVFYSPRIAKLLGAKKSGEKDQSTLKPKATKGTPVERTGLTGGRDKDTFNVRTTEQTVPAEPEVSPSADFEQSQKQAPEEDIHDLAEDIAKETGNAAGAASETAEVLGLESKKAPYQMHESRVPSSQFGRLWHYGGLATGMAFGAVSESLRRVTGSGEDAGGSLMLSAANMDRLVAKLSRMRGAALKLGQMMSFQDSKMLPKPIHDVLQRVQDSADYMPASQRNKVLAADLGSDWRSLFSSFDDVPMAAASIGQVHGAVLASTKQRVAVKVQYPGVADSIGSDLNNISLLLTASRLLPKGLYLDKTIANARTELAWECDYVREAECGQKFKELLSDEQDVFTVPAIIPEASGKQVLTAERMEGIGVTKAEGLDQATRDWIGTQILRLCLRELTEFGFMQTDPNWTNFLWNADSRKLELLDFGASRAYPRDFLRPYLHLLSAAARADTPTVLSLSVRLGYLTGHESPRMRDAHVASILTLAEPFSANAGETYDFRDQTVTERVRKLIPVMIRERLAPPPEETYSLHRKLSGAFLLCARLGSRVRCREMWERAMTKVEGLEEGD
ncbi:MAG: hypothetical protein M1833_000008 [Piccolia ochrophora]|nr:MAG: hypothetical protein M1833_000008 [Piccolia ochrophora]